jgi:hypothetical protein
MSKTEIGQINRAQGCCETVGTTCSQIIPRIAARKTAVFMGVLGAPFPIRKQ